MIKSCDGKQHIISFSGGKDSTAMLLMMIEKNMQIDRIINIDTTKEYPAMYKHIQKVQKHISPLKIEIYKIDYDYWFSEHIKTKGKRREGVGYGWPDFKTRWCTILKQECFSLAANNTKYNPRKRKLIKVKNIIEYIGIALDERHRIQKVNKKNTNYPLIDWNITEKQALEYCYEKGFDWGGLYKKIKRVSCWCCPLAGIASLRNLYFHFPELWIKLKKMDEKSWRQFRADYSIEDLERRFKRENKLGIL